MTDRAKALSVLAMNTLAFTACFAVWTMYGVLVTFFVDNKVYAFDKAEMGWLIGIPILTGSLLRLPAGFLTDKLGGRVVFVFVMLLSAVFAFLTSFADSYEEFLLGGLGFGLAGSSFAVGVAYTSVWFPRVRQGTALGIFGLGNAGAALTSMFAPRILGALTDEGARLEAWRQLPRLYAAGLVVIAVLFWIFTHPRKVAEGQGRTLAQRLSPLRFARVWRFGLYYVLFFGGFVALAQWLIPYYVNVYTASVATAGLLAAAFSLPTGLFRALGGWLSDRFGARRVMYWALGGCALTCLLLAVPRMDIFAPGEGLMAESAGTVQEVGQDRIAVAARVYALRPRPAETVIDDGRTLIWPQWAFWQEPVVRAGEGVVKRQLLARGVTHIYFQANMGIFTGLAFVLAFLMGIGMAAVFKHVADYFPKDVGVVGGIVGVLGGLGGFFYPILFGYLLKFSGIWTTCWMLFCGLAVVCLLWMHWVVRRMAPAGVRARQAPAELPEGLPTHAFVAAAPFE